MPLAITVTFDKKVLEETQHILRAIPRAFPRVMRRAINRTVDSAATDLKRRVSKEANAKAGKVSKGIGKKKASFTNLSGSVSADFYRLGLTEFKGTRQTQRGVTYNIEYGGRQLFESGFIATMDSGHRGAFAREENAAASTGRDKKGRTRKGRLPIYEAAGPSIWQVATNTPGLLKAVERTAQEKLVKQIDDQIGVEFRRWEKR